MAAVRAKKRGNQAVDRLINRELSFLDYDARVLEVAADASLPLLERVRFCSIFSSMLDEFFMVRVAGLIGQAAAGVAVRSPDGRTAQQTLSEARARVLELYAEQDRVWREELCPALAEEGIVVASRVSDLSQGELHDLEQLYEHEVYPVLTPLAVGPGQPFPYISALSVSLAVFARDPESGEERFARVKVPEGLPRFLAVGDAGRYVVLEEVLTHFLPSLFPGMEIVESSVFRVTRDADLEVSDEADDLLEAVELELRRRRFGEVTRLEVSSTISRSLRERLQQGLRVSDDLVYPVVGVIDLEDASELTKIDRPDLKLDRWVPVSRPPLANVDAEERFAIIRAGDVLVHHPYDSFAASFEAFANDCAKDPEVIALKSTVYRTSDESPLVPALIEAAENGKQSVCLVEIKARGDERRNIEWSRAMEQAGVHVAYGFSSMKIHAKMTLVIRREGGGLRRYVHLGTGNYNAVTARAYEDFGLFTADEDIAADVADLFNYVTGFGRPANFRKLLVAPFTLRQRLVDEIREVAAAARAGRKARIRIKVNGLTHTEVIDELYAASEAGARIELLVRGVCSLRPGVPGLSENIRVRSVLGRFLEHSRLYCFEAGDRVSYYLGSADMMPRNLDHRVEVVTPVEDLAIQSELAATFDTLLADNTASWELNADGVWDRARTKKDERIRSAQATMMRRARRRVSLARAAR
jgi:polyphosphate kinase